MEDVNSPYTLDEFREFIFSTQPDTDPAEYAVWEERLRESYMDATRDIGQEHILGSPGIQIISVSVQVKLPPPRSPRLGSWRVFGDICNGEPDSTRTSSLDVFSKSSTNSQYIDPDFPFLQLSSGPIFNFFPRIDLRFKLFAKLPRDSHCQPLIDDVIPFDYTDFAVNLFDRVLYRDFDTKEVSLRLKYITFRSACLAGIDFALDVPAGQQPRQLSVAGRMFASWHHKKEDFQHHQVHDDRCNCVCLFNTTGTWVPSGEYLDSRSMICVPSYATLVLDLILIVDNIDFHQTLDFPVSDNGDSNTEFQLSPDLAGRIRIQWSNRYYYDEEEEEEETTSGASQKKPKHIHPQVPQPICLHDTVVDSRLFGERMMEIFSVSVVLNDEKNMCRLNGSINVQDRRSQHRIFEIVEPNLSKKISHGTTLPLVGPSKCLRGSCFLQVHLRDCDGEEFCRGYVGWSDDLLRSPWMDKWLTSVIKGRVGYTLVNYALYPSAVSCAVSMFLSAPPRCGNVVIMGSVSGHCDGDELDTSYDKTYNRINLFQKGNEREPMQLEFGTRKGWMKIPTSLVVPNEFWIPVPLTKSAVCVPTDSSLVIDVELSAECEAVAPVAERLIGSVVLEREHKTWYMIQSENYQLFVTADWPHDG